MLQISFFFQVKSSFLMKNNTVIKSCYNIFQNNFNKQMKQDLPTPNTPQIATTHHHLPNFAQTFPKKPFLSSPKDHFLPVNQNSHLLHTKGDYMQQLLYFNNEGKLLRRFAFEVCGSQVVMLSATEVVVLMSVMRYNGDVRDFVNVWDFVRDTNVQFQHHTYEDEDAKTALQLLVFPKTKLICICESQYKQIPDKSPTIHTKLTYYKPQPQSQSYKKCHTYSYYLSPQEVSLQCMPTNLDHESMVGFVGLGGVYGYGEGIGIFCYEYDVEKDEGRHFVVKMEGLESDGKSEEGEKEENNLVRLLSIWKTQPHTFYIRIHKKSQKMFRQYIWNYKQNTLRPPTYLNQIEPTDIFYQVQFANNFREYISPHPNKIYSNELTVDPIWSPFLQDRILPLYIVYQVSEKQQRAAVRLPIQLLDPLKVGLAYRSLRFSNNQAVEYSSGIEGQDRKKSDLVIRSRQLPETYYCPGLVAVWMMDQLVGQEKQGEGEGWEEDLLGYVAMFVG